MMEGRNIVKYKIEKNIIFKASILERDYYYDSWAIYTSRIKCLVGDKEEIVERYKDYHDYYHRNKFIKTTPIFKNQDVHTYFIGKENNIYKYDIYFIPIIFGNKISIKKNIVDNIMLKVYKKDLLFDKVKSAKIFYENFKNEKHINKIKITINEHMSRKLNPITIFRRIPKYTRIYDRDIINQLKQEKFNIEPKKLGGRIIGKGKAKSCTNYNNDEKVINEYFEIKPENEFLL